MSKKIVNIVFAIGSVMVLISSVLVMENVVWGKYAFAAGAALFVIGRMKMVYTGDDFRLKRLNRMYFLSSLFLVAVSYMQFKGLRSWVAVLLMVAITEMYTTLRASWYEKAIREKEKAEAEKDQK
jgi:hypothetical protein